MIPPDELRHLAEGPRQGETPGGGLVEITVTSTDEVSGVLKRTQEVLEAVLRTAVVDGPAEDEWSPTLPAWFVRACRPEDAEETQRWLTQWRGLDRLNRAQLERQRVWTLSNSLEWLKPGERQWFWWGSSIHGDHEAVIVVEVPGWPFAVGALEWLLRASGADSVAIGESWT